MNRSERSAAASEGSAGFNVHKRFQSDQGHYEAVVTTQPLPRCHECGAKHPLAMNPPRDPAFCSYCDVPLPTLPAPREEPALLTGKDPSMLTARFLLWLGKLFANLSSRFDR